MTSRRGALSGASLTSNPRRHTGSPQGWACCGHIQRCREEKPFAGDYQYAHPCMPAGTCALSHLQIHSSRMWEQGMTQRALNAASSFLLPSARAATHVRRLFCMRNRILFARHLILRFSRRMVTADKTGSKWSASLTRPHRRRLIASCVGQLGKGVKPPLHPPCRLWRHAEPVPVSVPFGLPDSVSAPSRSHEVRP